MIFKIIYLSLILISLGMDFARHGQEKKGTYNGFVSLISVIIILALLHLSGFFNL